MPKKMVSAKSKMMQIKEAVKVLNAHLQAREVSTKEYFCGSEAIFELLDQDWDAPVTTEQEAVWRQGYEQCMVDIVDALSDEWGVTVWFEESP